MGIIVSSSQNKNEIEWDDGEVVIEDNLDLVNQMVADSVLNSPSTAVGDNAATGTLGDNGASVSETTAGEQSRNEAAASALVKLGNNEDAIIAPGKNDATTGESENNAATGTLGNNGTGVSETTAGEQSRDEAAASARGKEDAATGEKYIGGGWDTESEDMGFPNGDTDDDPSAKDVLDDEASAKNKSADDAATVAKATKKKATKKK